MIDHLDHATFELTLSPRAMTSAERQKKLRKARQEAGIKPLHVTPAERSQLADALVVLTQINAGSDVSGLLSRIAPDAHAYEVQALQAEVAALLSARSELAQVQGQLLRAERELQALSSKQGRDEQEYALTLRERAQAWDDNERLRAENKRLTAENGRLQTQLGSITAELVGILGQPSAGSTTA